MATSSLGENSLVASHIQNIKIRMTYFTRGMTTLTLAWENCRPWATLPLVFPAKWSLRNERRNSIMMTSYYPDLGSASDRLNSTTQIWVETLISMEFLRSLRSGLTLPSERKGGISYIPWCFAANFCLLSAVERTFAGFEGDFERPEFQDAAHPR